MGAGENKQGFQHLKAMNSPALPLDEFHAHTMCICTKVQNNTTRMLPGISLATPGKHSKAEPKRLSKWTGQK